MAVKELYLECPFCTGNKRVLGVIIPGIAFEWNCPFCKGLGKLKATRAREVRSMLDSWCKCGFNESQSHIEKDGLVTERCVACDGIQLVKEGLVEGQGQV